MPEVDIDGTYTQSFQIKKYNFFISNIILHTSVSIIISLMDADNRTLHTIQKQIEGEEYSAWGNDDGYLEKIVDKIVKEFLNIVEEGK